MPRQRGTNRESEELVQAICEKPRYMCPICVRLGLNIQNELYNKIELYVHLRLHKLDDLREELVKEICGEEVI